jgi:pilus assembly protein HofP
LLADERDPFLPAEDRCQTAQLAQWRYGGAVGHPHYWVGYLLDHRSNGAGCDKMTFCRGAGESVC